MLGLSEVTRNEILRRLPHASKSFLKRNAQDCPDSQTPSPKSKRSVRHDALGKAPREISHADRVVVRIKSFRTRLLDADNLVGGSKYFTDGLRYAGLISGDAEAQICLEVSQQKVATKEEEHTLIEIEPLDPKPPVPTSAMDRPALIEYFWEQCGHAWNRPAFDAFMETLSDEDLRKYIGVGKE